MALDMFDGREASARVGNPEKLDVQKQLKQAVEKDAALVDQLKEYPNDVLVESYAEVMRHYMERGQEAEAEVLRGFGRDLGLEDFQIADPVAYVSAEKRLLG